MDFQVLLRIYERLEDLVERLPGSLQQPILKEIRPVKELFLLQRPPRLALLGEPGAEAVPLVRALFGVEATRTPLTEEAGPTGWVEFAAPGKGKLHVLDLRGSSSEAAVGALLTPTQVAPDLYLFLRASTGIDSDLVDQLAKCEAVLAAGVGGEGGHRGAIGCLLVGREQTAKDRGATRFALEIEEARSELHACLHSKGVISERLITTLAVAPYLRFRLDGMPDAGSDERQNVDLLAQALVDELPNEAKLDMARLSGEKEAQRRIALKLVKSITAVCAAIGAQPIPIADFPVLTTLQGGMVAGVMYISGRETTLKLAGKFVTALGANLGAAVLFREGARALLKLFPGWGNAISGAVAAAGTYAVGRAAIAYFIEGGSIDDARRLFRKTRKRKKPPALPDIKE